MSMALMFDLIAVDRASAVMAKVGSEAEATARKVDTSSKTMKKAFAYAGLGAIALGAYAVKSAANFQTLTEKLVTTAGESQKRLPAVSKGLLDMAGKVGYTASELATGMYTVESAGFHASQGLKVMEAAAKGARVEGADLTDTTNAVSSALVDYHLKGSAAARVTNTLVAATGRGKTTFQDLASALPNVGAAGASAHIHLDELATAIATMTMHGTDATKAGTYLRQVIGQLEAPSKKASQVMGDLGINANKLSLTLASGTGHGLADAIHMVYSAIAQHTDAKGLVALTTAAPNTKAFKDAISGLPGPMTTAFGALSNMVGGVRSLQGFLQLGGENLKVYSHNLQGVRDQVAKGGKNVEGYAQQQATFNGKLADAKGALSALAVEVGNDLLPTFTKFVGGLSSAASWMEKNKGFTKALTSALIGLGGAFLVWKTATLAVKAYTAAVGILKGVQIVWIAATQGMTAAQTALDVAMDANPIGAVVIAIAALAAGLYYAWNHSKTFRTIVTDTFHAVGAAASWLWNDAIKPALRFIINLWLSTVGFFVDGAAKAFGWIPGIGPKLKQAASWFDNFKNKVNASLAGIHDKTVTLDVVTRNHAAAKVANQLAGHGGRGYHGFASGGFVSGPGTGTSDSIPAYLSHGEYVVRASAVKAVGVGTLNHINAQGYANGGAVRPVGAKSVSLDDETIDRLASAMLRARPNEVNVYGDGSYEREMRRQRVTRGGGGRMPR